MRKCFTIDAVHSKVLARIGAVIFVAVSITMTAIEMSRPTASRHDAVRAAPPAVPTDPLLFELRRCQALGAVGASDAACLRAWADNRRRFLSPGARPAASIADRAAPAEN